MGETTMKLLFLVTVISSTQVSRSKIIKRQTDSSQSDQFYLFSQLLESLGTLASTAGKEGGQFLEQQVEVLSSIVETVGNISDTINTSEFVKGVRGGAGTAAKESPALMETKVEMVDNTMQVGVI